MTWIELGAKQAAMFSDNHVAYTELLVTGNSCRLILSYVYVGLCRMGKVAPLESLNVEQKTNIWLTAKEFSNGRLEQDKLIQLVKALYSLEYYLNL